MNRLTTKMLRLLTQSFVFTITLASIASASTWGLGSGWSIGSAVGTSSPGTNSPSAIGQPQTEIVKVQTTFNPGIAPSGQFGDLLLWPGLSNGTGDLLQTTVESWPDQSWCGGSAADWCLRTSVYTPSRKKTDGAFAKLPSNTPVTITFERGVDGTWTQTAVVDNKVVSTVTSPSGPMTLFGIVIQCDYSCAGTVSPQIYTNTVITLATASPSWGSSATVGTGSGVYGDGSAILDGPIRTVWDNIRSTDGGKTWRIGRIQIGAM